MHPDFYLGPPMVKPPVVYLASLLRASGSYVDDESWIWLSDDAGQRLFYPPNVSGWDDNRWLDTSRMRARWLLVTDALDEHLPRPLERRLRPDRGAGAGVRQGARRPGTTRRCAPSTTTRCSASRSNAWSRARSPTGSSAPTARCARTPCAS